MGSTPLTWTIVLAKAMGAHATSVVGTLQSQKGQLNNLLLLGEGLVGQQDAHFVGERLIPVGPA